MGIERAEYAARQAAARELARERGFSALVAWSRGGSTQDHYADAYYLTGFYTHQPFIPDEPGHWRAHGHTALVLPVDGPTTLLIDMTESQDPKPAADCVRYTEDLVRAISADCGSYYRGPCCAGRSTSLPVAGPTPNDNQVARPPPRRSGHNTHRPHRSLRQHHPRATLRRPPPRPFGGLVPDAM